MHESLFQGKRGEWTGIPYGLILKDDAKPFRSRPYPILLKQKMENRNRWEHKYKEGGLVLIVILLYERGTKPKISKFAEGPYKVLKVFSNGTLRILRGSYEENISIRRLRPYYKRG